MDRFERGEKNQKVAAVLRVSERSVERWRRSWRERGAAGVAAKGSPGRPQLDDAQVAKLEGELERGPLAHGWGGSAVDTGIWSLVNRDLGNLAAADLAQITRAVKRRLKQIQYRPNLVDGCLVGTGLMMGG
nr:helix-turn-helix domain-containing protein [Streptomyces asoensis]